MAQEYFEKTPNKANRWFRAFVILTLLYGITYSLYSIFNWIFFLGSAFSLFMSYFKLPVQPKIFQKQARPFDTGARATYGSSTSSATEVDRIKKIVRVITISVVSFFVFLLLMKVFNSNDDADQATTTTTTTEQEEQSSDSSSSSESTDESAASLTSKGNELFNDGQYGAADGYYDSALAIDPNYMEAVYGKGIVLYQNGNREEANTYFTRAYEGGYRYAWLSWVLADTYDKSGATTRAVELYKESVNLDSSYVDSYNRLAELVPSDRDKYLELAQKHANN